MNLIDDPKTFIPRFCMKVANLAIFDHETGRKTYRTGQQICAEIAEDWRINHRKLASTVYRQMRWSLEVTERDSKQLAGSPPGPTEGDPT
jgi:hypothetical protein